MNKLSRGFTLIEFLVILGIVVIVALLLMKAGVIDLGAEAYLNEKLRESPAFSFAFKAVFIIAAVVTFYCRFKQMVHWRNTQREKAARRGVPMVRRSIRVFFWLSLIALMMFAGYKAHKNAVDRQLASPSIGANNHASLLQYV